MRPTVITASLVAAALLAGSATAQTPTLGELAKREEARRKALKGPAKVLTPQEAPKGTTAAPQPAAAPAPEKSEEKPAQKPEEPAKDEAWWRGRVSQVREELRRNEMFAEALRTRINSLTNDFSARDDPYQRSRIGQDRVKALAELDRVKADIDLGKQKLADIEDEARRAGVPPGWVR